jgi:uncharacterized RDD family membrane protein YckC
VNIYCSFCGAPNAANARFCRSCRKLIALPGAHTVVRPPLPPAGEHDTIQHAQTPSAAHAVWPAYPAPRAHAELPGTQTGDRDGHPTAAIAPPVTAGAGTRAAPPVRAGYHIDPATGLAYDPHFKLEPLPDRPHAGMAASFFPRLGALLVDSCILSVLWFCLVGLAAAIDAAALGVLVTFLGPALYFIAFWATDGRTPGYRAARLRLIHTDGSTVGVGAGIVRYVGSLISMPLFCLGYLWMLWDPRAQTWHDKMADTTVVQE